MNAPEDDVDLSGLSDGSSDDPEDSDEFVIGTMVGRYQLCVELASGGMAKVYLARRIGEGGFDKLVALKRIHPHLSSQSEFVEMFMDEARIASRIDHPNVCAVFDFGRAGREQFIAMEYLLGETLGRVWRRARTKGVTGTPAWWALSMRIVAEAAEGLHAAHELTSETGEPLLVVHRDVSPSNVFVTYEGAVKVVDFGVARAQNKVHQTRDGRVKGHYAYMAPEQARAGNVDRRADLWSLGVLLWELLAGQRLFRRESEAATLMAVVCGEVPPLAAQCPTLPTEVTELVERLLTDDPELRPASARAVSRDLERAIARLGDPVGRGDLAQLMEQLFPEELERRKQMVAAARRMPTVTRLERGEPGEGRSSRDGQTARRRNEDARRGAASTEANRRGLQMRPALAGVGLVALLGAGTAAWALAPAGLGGAGPAASDRSPSEPPPGEDPRGEARDADSAAVVRTAAPAAADAGRDAEPATSPARDAGATPTEGDGGNPAFATADEDTRTRERSPPREVGTVNVATPGGWADVYRGGRRIGRSPGRFTLPPGRYTLTLRPFGDGPERTVDVEVRRGETSRVSVAVSP